MAEFEPTNFSGEVHCEPPNDNIQRFNGYM